ncbi:MAG: c-type cytochrome [Gammaproteobacteria bacterium]|nr:c-type cytochrome [Gammaproteobacteria bacterium]
MIGFAEGTKKNLAMDGTGVPKLKLPNRKADVVAGEKIYQQSCMACHGSKGLGTKAADFVATGSYTFPPLAGKDSFNNGAGMSRLKKASQFIHANMPLGVNSDAPVLTTEQSYDVAAYVLSLPRENKKGRENDFPNKDFRPTDYPVPAYFNDDKTALEKAKLGPY